ncbi:MAG: M48 family metalloprotease [Candidatus Nitrosotenuis sp.]|nr:M48 family metalloprotease [Candidatus Nitrosotenuis sp.]
MTAYDGISFLKDNFTRKETYPKDIPELKEFANKIGLELSPQPFWETDKKKMKVMSRGCSKKSNKIIFGKDFLASLTNKEKIFVAGHEFLHLYGHELLYYPIIFVPILGLIVLMQYTLIIPQNIMVSGFLGATVGCICLGKRSFESIADINGAINVNREDAINALKKAYVGKENKSFNLHPSLKARIKNLENYYKQK